MKRISVIVVVTLVVLFTIPPEITIGENYSLGHNSPDFELQDSSTQASAAGAGFSRDATAYMTRNISSQTLRILNSYSSTSQHTGFIDLTEFQIPGWDLYSVKMDVATITAAAERETTGITVNSDIQIQNSTIGAVTDALYQQFYNMPHDGRLENYSFGYKAPYYSTALGKAYLVVRSAYNDSQTNITSWITPFNQISSYTNITHDCVSDEPILDANMPYFVVIDGTAMIGIDIGSGIWLFNWIYWRAQDITGTETGYHYRNDNTWYQYVGLRRREAELKYTYTPWNKSTNSALMYFNPIQIDIKGNNSPVDGLNWLFTDDSSILAINFNSNQSVEISYSMNLSYRKAVHASSSWDIVGSGDVVSWNVTTQLEYPATSEERFLNISVPTSWTPLGLYNTSNPGDNHDNYENLSGVIRCSNMANDTWTLMSSSYNFLQSIQTFNHLDNSEFTSKASLTSDIDINSTITEEDLDPVVTGSTNLTIQRLGVEIWTPTNVTVSDGKTYYYWDISSTSSLNGIYIIDVFWSNGTEAGYQSKSLILYYPTSFSATSYQIDAFTDSTFPISVYLEDIFTPQGLDGDFASVYYSFDSGTNTSLTDHSNGTWTGSVPTTGKASGIYSIIVYAEGYAIENKSLTMNVTLIHNTETLTIQWSNTNNISYIQTTNLLVQYRRVGGTDVTGATVNVTIDGTPFPLEWDGDLSLYKIQFNGTDSFSGFHSYNLVISAWKEGYKPQVDTSQNLTIHEEYTDFSISWSYGTNITYIQSTTLIVSYRMSNTTAIQFANVTVTDGTAVWRLNWNGTDGTYWIKFNGTDSNPGYGTHSLTIHAEKYGYVNQQDASYSLTLRKVPTSLFLTWSDGNIITYLQSTTLVVNYSMQDGFPVTDATVNVTIGSGFWILDYNPLSGMYELLLNGSDIVPGFGIHSVTVLVGKIGFDGKADYLESFTQNLEPTTLSVTWSAGFDISYVQQTTLNVTFLLLNGTPIVGATVNVTISGHMWNLTWDGSSSYLLVFNGSDSPPGFGSHNLTILVGKYGYVNHIDNSEDLILSEEATSISTEWIGGISVITYAGSTILSVNYTMSDGLPVEGATVYAAISTETWNLTWDIVSKTYRLQFYGTDNPPDLGFHTIAISASRFGFITGNDSTTLTIVNEPTTLLVELIPSDSITYMNDCILSVSYLMNSNNSAITDAIVYATIAGVQRQMVWNISMQTYYLHIDGNMDLPSLGAFSILVEASRYGFDSGLNSSRNIILTAESTSLSVRWANDINNPEFYSYTYLIVEYTYGSSIPVLNAQVNVTIGTDVWELDWNITEEYYQLRFNGSDSIPGVGTHALTVMAWKYGFIGQTNSDEQVEIPVIPTKLNIVWTDGDTITYVEMTTLQAFYTMYNDSLILGATVNVTINGVTLILDWNNDTHAYERTFLGSDSSLDFTTYSLVVRASQDDFQSLTNTDESLTKQLEPTTLVISWIGGNNITYFSQSILSVQFLTSYSIPISTGVLNASINGVFWVLVWNGTSQAYETTIRGNDTRLGYATFGVLINASSFGFVTAIDSTQNFTIRLEDTIILFDWIPNDTISYLDVTVFRIFYLYSSDNSSVIGATVNATYVLTWEAVYNSSSGAYEITFTGADIPSPTLGSHTFFVLAGKANHLAHSDISQTLTIVQEDTYIHSNWLNNNNTITYIESATIYINYSIASTGESIVDAYVTIRIGTKTWEVNYNYTLELYTFIFTGDMNPPGLGTFVLYISATYVLHEGFKDATDNSQTLTILSESVKIHSYWIGGDTITYIGSTILVVNYTMSNGSAIPLATVNVTIGLDYWNLIWHEASQTYRLMFNGSDSLPGIGTHELDIRAGRLGFDELYDSTLHLAIIEEPTSLIPRWSEPNENNITYFEYTYLFVEYIMSSSSPILGASVNVTIDLVTWKLVWNATEGAYCIRFNGSDISPGFGSHNLVITTLKYGFEYRQNTAETLEVSKDPTSIQITWSNGNEITFVESTILMVYYRMSNGTPITSATLNVSFGFSPLPLIWNYSTQAYHLTFTGDMDPPGLGTFTLDILASGDVFVSQSVSTSFTIRKEPTTATASWTPIIDWTQSGVIGVDYRDSFGRLITGATQKIILIDGIPYTLQGTNGTYWYEFDNSFDLGHHVAFVNISKYGYNYATNSSIGFDVIEAATNLDLVWNAITIDYLGYFDLVANYSYVGTGATIPMGEVKANITVDGSLTFNLTALGDAWIISFTGVYLDLGPHLIIVQAQAYGYSFAEESEILTVNEVTTDALSVTWNPSNLTIEYTDSLSLVVDYTFYSGDVPDNATVNVTINTRVYNLLYSSGAWRINIQGNQIGTGYHDAVISAWLYGYAQQTQITIGVNVTLAANSFLVTWEPWSLSASYVDIVNVSVVYTQDFAPILGASVQLSINGIPYDLIYSPIDEMWHFSIRASTIDLGIWNVTVTANKTGYADGWYSDYLTINPALTILDASALSYSFYYDESTVVTIYYQMSNTSYVPNSVLSFTLLGVEQAVTWNTNHWTANLEGYVLDVGVHNFEVNVSAYGFTRQFDTITITVNQIPTHMIYNDSIAMNAQESFTLRFTFIDNRTSSGIPAALTQIDWIGSSNLIDLGNGTYLVQIGGSSLHIGNYLFDIVFILAGHANGTGTVDIDVNPIPTELLFTSHIVQYENETIMIEVGFRDHAHSIPIDWAVVIATLDGVQYILLYDSATENYTLSILLGESIEPGSYQITISANAIDCEAREDQLALEVLEKSTYKLDLDVAEQVNAGEVLFISVTVYMDSQPIGNTELTLYIIISSEAGTRTHTQIFTADDMGVAIAMFDVPDDATGLDILVHYAGSISVWPTQTSLFHVDVTSGAMGFIEMILSNPVLLSAVVGGVSLSFLGLALIRRRRGLSKDIMSSPVTSSTMESIEPISLVEPIDRMKNEIIASESGLTRVDLSKRLGISSSKIGLIVKDLLESDSNFYEFRIGSKRLIRKR